MFEAITYQNMLKDINSNQVTEDTIGILITRPDLEVGKSILNSLNYYHHLSGHNTNFYLPGYGAYWYGTYPNGQVNLQNFSKWKYSDESELLMLEYKDGILSFDNMMQFYLDNMMRDRVIVSVSSFFQQLFETCKEKESLKDISNALGKDKLIQVIKETILNNIPSSLANVFTQEKYFCVRNCNKSSVR